MKTAISIEAQLLEETDRTAKRLGFSRSRLISLALKNYLRERRNLDILEQLNHVYGEQAAIATPTPAQMKTKFRSILRDRW